MFQKLKDKIFDTHTDEFGVVTDVDTGLLIYYPVDEASLNPIQIAIDKYDLGHNFTITIQFIAKNISEYDKKVRIKFKGFPEHFIYQSRFSDIGTFDKSTYTWDLGIMRSKKTYYLGLDFKYTQPIGSIEIEYEYEVL